MIVYTPFWETMTRKDISTYALINSHNVKSSTLDKLRHNRPLSTITINDLCRILDCDIGDIARYIPGGDDQTL